MSIFINFNLPDFVCIADCVWLAYKMGKHKCFESIGIWCNAEINFCLFFVFVLIKFDFELSILNVTFLFGSVYRFCISRFNWVLLVCLFHNFVSFFFAFIFIFFCLCVCVSVLLLSVQYRIRSEFWSMDDNQIKEIIKPPFYFSYVFRMKSFFVLFVLFFSSN